MQYPVDSFEDVKREVTSALTELFPIEEGDKQIRLENLIVEDNIDPADVTAQAAALDEGKTLAVPVKADVVVSRNGRDVGRRRMKVLDLPRMTERGSFIHNGNEYHISNLFTRKAGVYHRVRESGDAVADFNLANKSQFAGRRLKIRYDPATSEVSVMREDSMIPLVDFLRMAGTPDSRIKEALPPSVWEANVQASKPQKSSARLAKWLGVKQDEVPTALRSVLEDTELYPETTERTLGVAARKVTPDIMLRSTQRLVNIVKGEPEDNQEALEFQRIAGAPELFGDQLRKSRTAIERKIKAAVRREDKGGVRSMVPQDALQRPFNSLFTTSLANQTELINPLQALAATRRTTIMGPHGGIKSEHVVSDEAKMIDPSHLGYLDPVHTPEGPRLGVTLSVPLGTRKNGRQLESRFLDAKTGREVWLDPSQLRGKSVAFPDEYKPGGRKLVPRRGKVTVQRDGEMVEVSPGKVDYIIPSPRELFGVTSNLIPFLASDQGNRTMTASRQAEQAVPLKNREAPLVQVLTDKGTTFEEELGREVARTSPVAGTVAQVKEDAVLIKDRTGQTHRVPLFRNFGSKASSLFDSEVKVKAGDAVKAGDVVADTTFTRDGVLALGTNLRTGYLPLKGYNFEDGIVISESAAQKLTSQHIHKPETALGQSSLVDRRQFVNAYPALFNKDQLANVEDSGVVRVGARVRKGDPLLLALHDPTDARPGRPKRSRRSGRRYVSGALTWDKDVEGEVVKVQTLKERGVERKIVHIRTDEPAKVGDKLVGRHGNKGVITRIMTDSQMPYVVEDGEKKVLDIALNPMGVPGRINLGQVQETAAGKVAEKRGEVYKVKNFDPAVPDYTEQVAQDLTAAGFAPDGKETLFDPETEKPFRQKAAVGQQYFYKLRHQVDKKVSARSGSGAGRTSSGGSAAPYDINHAPSGGAPHGGMSLGELGIYALLAHGARENLHEMQAYKSEKNTALWDALREGTPLPPPTTPFVYQKFLGMLNGVRVNVRRHGNSLQLVPFTEEQVKQLAPKAIPQPGLVLHSTTAEPIKGGLFDPEITGGLEGDRWSRFELPEPIPNPVFEDAVKKVLGINQKRFRELIRGEEAVNGKRGGAAIEEMLKGIDVKEERKRLEERLRSLKPGTTRDSAYKKYRIVKALDEAGLDPTVYMMQSVPVLPPRFRPITPQADGRLMTNDLNFLYKDVAFTAEGLQKLKDVQMDYVTMAPTREGLYDGVKALSGLGGNISRRARSSQDDSYKGIIDLITGKVRRSDGSDGGRSKEGFFRKNLLRRRQDFSARSTITVEPGQDLDELGIPEKIAWTLYQPFAERELVREGIGMLDAMEEYQKKTPRARHALERAMSQRPVLFKRDPALHKFNVQAFKPRLVKGSALEMHPLAVGGFNADFDGDAMSVFLPVSDQAAREAAKMFPSRNLFSPTTGAIMHTPGHEALLGLYLLTKPGERTKKAYTTKAEAEKALNRGEISLDNVIKVGGAETTLGRLRVESVLPPRYRETGKKSVQEMTVLDSKRTKELLSDLGKNHEQDYGRVTNALTQLGNDHSYKEGFSIGLDDFRVIEKGRRDKILAEANRRADDLVKRGKKRTDPEVIGILRKADDAIDKMADERLKRNPTNIYQMVTSGSRGSPEQLKQIVSTPGLVKNARDEVVPFLVPSSYSEGLDTSAYWVTLQGARKGTLQKTQGVAMPGYMTRLMINSTVDQLVTEDDCGTKDGVRLSTEDKDIMDRYLARPSRIGGKTYAAGTVVTPHLLAAAKKEKKGRLEVRSPTRCQSEDGICKKCMGLSENGRAYNIGDNVGVVASQAVGEPSTQLSLNVFHQGGLAKGKGSESMGTFKRLEELLTLNTTLPFTAPLAPKSGKVEAVKKADRGGLNVTVSGQTLWVPPGQDLRVKAGQRVARGTPLSTGPQNPADVLNLRGLHPMQDYVTDQIQNVLQGAAPVKRRNIEVVVKAMTDVTQIEDPGDHPEWVPGDMRPITKVNAWNRQAARQGKRPVRHEPQVKGVKLLPKELKEDWMARLNFESLTSSLTQAFREGWKSNLHGFHPIPGLAAGSEFGKTRGKVENWVGQY